MARPARHPLEDRLAALVEMGRRVDATRDRKGGGWQVYLAARKLLGELGEAEPDPALDPWRARAEAALQRRMQGMDARKAYNRLSVELHEKSDQDLVRFRRRLGSLEYEERLEAVSTAGELDWEEALPSLRERLEIEDHPFVLSKLTKVIGGFGDLEDLPLLEPFLAHDDDRVRANTVEGIEQLPGDAKFDVLRPLLDDPAPRVKTNALLALQGLGEEAYAGLLGRMTRSTMASQRRSALYAVSFLPGSEASDLLAKLMRDEELDIQHQAIARMGRRGGFQAAEALVALIEETEDQGTRGAALGALQELRDSSSRMQRRRLQELLEPLASELGPAPPATAMLGKEAETLESMLTWVERGG
jgi:HEAT repeat protein